MSHVHKVALITGSTSGIGLAVAHALASKQVDVIVTGFGDDETITSIVNELKSRYGVRVDYVAYDLSVSSEIESLWSAVTNIYPDGVDILINNAGFMHVDPVEFFPDEMWQKSIAVMLTAPFQLIKRCIPAMKKKGYGRIVNMSSAAGVVGVALTSAYVTVKHGLIGLTKGVALETAAHGDTCNAVCPTATQTPMMDSCAEAFSSAWGVSVEDFTRGGLSSMPSGKYNTVEQALYSPLPSIDDSIEHQELIPGLHGGQFTVLFAGQVHLPHRGVSGREDE